MGMECDMKKRVSHLETIGRKICSDLRNFQKERTILSQEAKCLLREMEKRQARGRRYGRNKHANNTSCTCAIWEKDLIKDNESDLEESSKFPQEDDELLKCKNCCDCCGFLNEENDQEDLLEIGKCSICRFDEVGDPFHCTESVTMFNHDDNYNAYYDSHCFEINDTVESDIDDVNCTVRSCDEACTIDSSEFSDVCAFCKENDGKNMRVTSTNCSLNINNENDMQDLIERQRGGAGGTSDDSESANDETTNTSICTCDCDICVLRNKDGDKPPCCLRGKEPHDYSSDNDCDEDLQLNHPTVSEISENHQYCKITKLREALEKLKNRNHTLRKLLKNRDCLITNSMMEQSKYKFFSCLSNNDDNNNEEGNKNLRDDRKEPLRELVAILKILQSKCRTKDGMIVALADELKECATDERIKRILEKLIDPKVHCNIIDFDRSTLWKYLAPKQFNQIEKHSYKRKRIVIRRTQCNEIMIGIFILSFIFLANIHYRYQYTVMFVFHAICETLYRVYEILHNFQQCFAFNHIMILIIENCINFFDTFIALFNCHQLGVSVENITRDLTFFSDDGFPWLSTFFIGAIIFIPFLYRICYPLIATCSESLQNTYNTCRNDMQNEHE